MECRKAILMAAGKGNRISRMIQDIPKSTLPIGGVPLIRITVEKLLKLGIEPVVVAGYHKDTVVHSLEGLPVKYYHNPFYAVTNSIASLWFARQELTDDVLIMNADVYVSDEILDDVLRDPRQAVMSIDVTRRKTGDYFFATTESGAIKKFGKELPLEERSCEYVGLAKVRREFLPRFTARLDELIGREEYMLWWENVLYSFAGQNKYPIYTIDVKNLFWSEIDYFDDYERILKYLADQSGC